jgi:hypothetical protein
MTSPATLGFRDQTAPPYPDKADALIRGVAHQVEFRDIANLVKVLDEVKNQLLGNAERVEQLAHQWVRDTTMNDGKQELGDMKGKLASYWSGPACDAFTSYTDGVSSNLDMNGPQIAKMGETLAAAVETVFNTYASAIEFIGTCAADLVKLGVNTGIFAATVEVPGLDILTGAEWIQTVVDTMAAMIQNVTSLIARATEQIGQYKSQAVGFAAAANQFQVPQSPPESATHVGLWHVKPPKPA